MGQNKLKQNPNRDKTFIETKIVLTQTHFLTQSVTQLKLRQNSKLDKTKILQKKTNNLITNPNIYNKKLRFTNS